MTASDKQDNKTMLYFVPSIVTVHSDGPKRPSAVIHDISRSQPQSEQCKSVSLIELFPLPPTPPGSPFAIDGSSAVSIFRE